MLASSYKSGGLNNGKRTEKRRAQGRKTRSANTGDASSVRIRLAERGKVTLLVRNVVADKVAEAGVPLDERLLLHPGNDLSEEGLLFGDRPIALELCQPDRLLEEIVGIQEVLLGKGKERKGG